MKPGDFIEWTDTNGELVDRDSMWSSVLRRFVHIGGVNMLIAIYDGQITWLNAKGLHTALELEIDGDWRRDRGSNGAGISVIVRVVKNP